MEGYVKRIWVRREAYARELRRQGIHAAVRTAPRAMNGTRSSRVMVPEAERQQALDIVGTVLVEVFTASVGEGVTPAGSVSLSWITAGEDVRLCSQELSSPVTFSSDAGLPTPGVPAFQPLVDLTSPRCDGGPGVGTFALRAPWPERQGFPEA